MTDGHASRPFISHLQAFRGFAILCVVALHAWGDQVTYFGGATHGAAVAAFDALNESLLHDGTTFFSLISGLLFPMALRSRGWVAFFRGRVLHVASPYIVMSVLFTVWNHFDRYQPAAPGGQLGDYVAAILQNLWTGRAYYHLWYIPIVIALSVLTPLVAWLCDRPRWHWLLALVMLAPLVVSRTSIVVSWSSVGYFLGSYAVGMLAGARYDAALGLARRYRGVLWIVVALSTLLLLGMYRTGFDRIGFVSVRESMFYVQKLALAALVLVWLRDNEARLPRWLMTSGTYAFPIFFVHAFLLTLFAHAQGAVGLAPSGVAGMWLAGALFIAASMWIAVLLARLIRRVFGSYSRSVIGA